MNFYLRKGVPPTGLKMGGTVDVKICLNQRNRRLKALFSHYSQVLTRVEGGDRRPQHASWRVGVSC